MMTRIEYLQSIFQSKCRYKYSLCYKDQFTSDSMLFKDIPRTANESAKVKKFCLTEEVIALDFTSPAVQLQRKFWMRISRFQNNLVATV